MLVIESLHSKILSNLIDQCEQLWLLVIDEISLVETKVFNVIDQGLL
jgi:hypothetical protein